MLITKFLFLVPLILNIFQYASANTIEVNPGQSIQTAVNSMTGGDTLIVNAGTYNEKILIEGKSGSASAHTVIRAEGDVIIDGNSLDPVDREGLITIRNTSYIILEGFEIKDFSTSGGATPIGILVDNSGTNISIFNNRIHHITNNSTCLEPCEEGAHGMAIYGTGTVLGIRNLLIQGNEIDSCILQASEAFVINGNVSGFKVLYNNVHNNNNIAYDFIGYEDECDGCDEEDRARNGIVKGNIAENNSSFANPWYGGGRSAAGFYVDGGSFIVFDGNQSINNDFGFEFASEMPMKKTDSILMINNLVYDNAIAGLIMGGYAEADTTEGGGSSEAIYVYNNTFFNQKEETEIEFQNRVKNCRIANNIIYCRGSVTNAYYDSEIDNTGNFWGTNLWWGADTSFQSGNLKGISIVEDPILIDTFTRNLSIPANSPAINQGDLQASLTWSDPFWTNPINAQGLMDFNHEIRIEDGIDLGADEYNILNSAHIDLQANSIGIFHNPFNDFITIKGSTWDYEVQILNSSLQPVMNYSNYHGPFSLDLSCLGAGLHFLKIGSNIYSNLGIQIIIKE